MFHSLSHTFRIIGCLGRSAWCWEQHEGRLIWPRYVFPIIRCTGFMIINPSSSPFSFVVSNHRFSNSRSTRGVGFVKIASDNFCGNRVFRMGTEFCCHLCCSSLWFSDTILFSVWRSLSLSFGFRPQLLLFPWSVYVVTTFGTAALDSEVAVWLETLQLNAHQQSVNFENLTSLLFCSTFIQTATKYNL